MSFQAGSTLSFVQGREASQTQVNSTTSPPTPLDISISDAIIVLRSSDLVNFRVHKSILAMVSPFFKDLLSLPQPSDSESIDGLPVVQLSEDAELLNTLVSMLYPVRRVIPDSYDKVLNLLAACQKYDMVQVQSSIRAKVNRGSFPAPVGTEVFRAYAIASNKGLDPEMEMAARLTLDHPMTFETLGEALQLFDGSVLRDLTCFRKRCRDNLVKCVQSFLEVQGPGTRNPASVYCENCGSSSWLNPNWLHQVLSPINDLKQVFKAPVTPSNMHGECLKALQRFANCKYCGWSHATNNPTFFAGLESKLARARDEVPPFLRFQMT